MFLITFIIQRLNISKRIDVILYQGNTPTHKQKKEPLIQIDCIIFQFQQQMRSDIVTIEPQIVQFGRDNSQTIKIINHTSSPISNFFFCLYNSQKFSFTPDTFSLAPNEHKLVTVFLKIKSSRSVAKQFAYLKSTQINKRITLVINQFQSPDVKIRSVEEGMEDMNTLSSREYRDVQTQAIQKIIKEKQAYIAMLEKERQSSVNRNINFRTEQSGEKAGLYRRQVDELEMKLTLIQSQKESALKENIALHNKFQQYRKMCQSDLKNYEKISQEYRDKVEENVKLHDEISYLENQGNQFLSKVEEKQYKIRQLEQINRKLVEDNKKQVEKKLDNMEERLQEQKNNYQHSLAYAEERIKELEKQLETSQTQKQRINQYEKDLKRKEDQIKTLMATIQSQRNSLKELEGEKKKALKLELTNENIAQKNAELTSKVNDLEKVNHNLREQIFVYKSKMAENDASSDKMNQYLQIALESCRNENQALKRTKNQLQKSLDEIMNVNRQSHDSNKSMSSQVSKYKEQIKLLNEIKDNLEKRHEQMKQEHHLAMMQLKTENIQLLEKMSLGSATKREDIIRRLEQDLFILKKQLAKSNVAVNELTTKNQELVVDNTKLTEKVKKYKKQTKKELRNINDTAINQLNKEHQEKKKMVERINELEEVILNYSCDKMKEEKENVHKVRSEYDHQLLRQRSSSRAIGIKDQRKEIQYSQASNSDAYNQLGQLRQVYSFVKNQEQKWNKAFDLTPQSQPVQQKLDSRPIFRVIKFFKKLENKLDQSKSEGFISNVKEIQYLKGRIKELEVIRQDKQNLSSINLNKTREHCSQLLEYVREQMKSQYKKLNEAMKLSEQKFDLLKKKIYEEYRARIIDNLNKKDKHSIAQLQTILERFIDGLANLSHKEAVLHKQIKLKQNARRQNSQLKGKVNQLNYLLQEKKGHCTRDPIKLIYNETELQWQESLKRQAELLTLTAQYQRIKEELELVQSELADSRQNSRHLEKELDDRSAEILKLKKYQIEIQSNYENQVQRQYDIIEDNKKKIMEMTKTTKETVKHYHKEKQYNQIKESYDRQKEIIKQLKDKQKMLEEMLDQTHRSGQKEKRRANEEQRILETMRDLKENNRQLRNQNSQLKQKLSKMEQDLEKKTLYMKNLRGDIEENRIRVQRKEEVQNDSLREENKKLIKDLQKIKEDLEKLKKKKEKELAQHKNEIDKLKNQNIIIEKSLESIIRALMDTVRKIYGRLKRVIKKKKGKQILDNSKVFEKFQGVHVDALKIDEVFEEVLTTIEEAD